MLETDFSVERPFALAAASCKVCLLGDSASRKLGALADRSCLATATVSWRSMLWYREGISCAVTVNAYMPNADIVAKLKLRNMWRIFMV